LGLGIVHFAVRVSAAYANDAIDLGWGIIPALMLSLFAAVASPIVFLTWFVSYLDLRARVDSLTRDGLRAEFDHGAERQAGLTGP
jgi:hypothetical protein